MVGLVASLQDGPQWSLPLCIHTLVQPIKLVCVTNKIWLKSQYVTSEMITSIVYSLL